jgi:predicted secreted protein
MSIMSAIVLYAILWFLTLFVVLPLGQVSQAETGSIVPGTPASAPAAPRLRQKFRLTSIVAGTLWIVVIGVVLSGWIGVEDFDLFTRFGGGQIR